MKGHNEPVKKEDNKHEKNYYKLGSEIVFSAYNKAIYIYFPKYLVPCSDLVSEVHDNNEAGKDVVEQGVIVVCGNAVVCQVDPVASEIVIGPMLIWDGKHPLFRMVSFKQSTTDMPNLA